MGPPREIPALQMVTLSPNCSLIFFGSLAATMLYESRISRFSSVRLTASGCSSCTQ